MTGLVLASSGVLFAQQARSAAECQPTGALAKIPELPEASGLALGRRVKDRLWTHNDSGEPVIFALDARGAVTSRVTVPGAKVDDWEAIAVGPCSAGSCIHVADIGDNNAGRDRITVYRMPEPDAKNEPPRAADVFHATYPDGPHDAETLLVAADGRLYIVTKGETASVALYAFPRELSPGTTVRLERIGQPRTPGRPGRAERITDGSVSPDGQWVVLRTNDSVSFYRASEFFAGTWRETRRVDLGPLGEPQGEGVALGADNVLYLTSEGGGRSRPGTFVRLPCTPGR